jgi:hypothetical protein
MGPTGSSLDEGQAQLVVDGPQTHHACPRTKLVEHSHIRSAMPMGQPRKLAPSPLLGQQGDQLVERVGRRQCGQQMDTPQLGGAQGPMRPSAWTQVPVLVDEIVRNIWVDERQKLRRTSQWECRVHGPARYLFELYLSAPSPLLAHLKSNSQIPNPLQRNS